MIVRHKRTKFLIAPSQRKGKQLMARNLRTGKAVHFGDPAMPEYPGTSRGDNYCARSSGIKGANDTESANFWARKLLWNCKGKKSLNTLKGTGLKRK